MMVFFLINQNRTVKEYCKNVFIGFIMIFLNVLSVHGKAYCLNLIQKTANTLHYDFLFRFFILMSFSKFETRFLHVRNK